MKQRLVLETSILLNLSCMRKPKLQGKFFLHIALFYCWFSEENSRHQWWKKNKIVLSIFWKNQFSFFYSLSTSNINATPATIWKRTRLVKETPPADKSFPIKVILADMQGSKIGIQIFFNLTHYIELNCHIFTFQKNLVLWFSNILHLLDIETSLFFVTFYKSWKQIFLHKNKLWSLIILNHR